MPENTKLHVIYSAVLFTRVKDQDHLAVSHVSQGSASQAAGTGARSHRGTGDVLRPVAKNLKSGKSLSVAWVRGFVRGTKFLWVPVSPERP